MGKRYTFSAGQKFIADLADALGVSFKAVEPHSEVSTFRRIRPNITADYVLYGTGGCFQGGTALARIRLFEDSRYPDGLIVSVAQSDREVIPHVRRLFQEQFYDGVGFSYLTGPDVPNKVQVLRRHAA